MTTKYLLGITALLTLLGCTTSTFAGWEVINLHPAGSYGSRANGVSGGQPVGYVDHGDAFTHAGLWSGSARNWVDLSPDNVFESEALAASGAKQVGFVHFQPTHVSDVEYRAMLWNGTEESGISLAPATSIMSAALGVHGEQQVGYAGFEGYPWDKWHAILWHGTSADYVDLNPVGMDYSEATAVADGQQVGCTAEFHSPLYSPAHAALWSGSAASWVDLNPADAWGSRATGVSQGWQVGFCDMIGGGTHASLWHGTSASFVNLNPTGSDYSKATGVSNGKQVGWACFDLPSELFCAGMWSGTADSWVNLHDLLGAGYTSSQARAIEVTDNDIWIVGSACMPSTDGGVIEHAVMWHQVIPEPSSILALGSGLLALGGLIRRRR